MLKPFLYLLWSLSDKPLSTAFPYFFTLTGLQILTANYNSVTNVLTWASFIAMPFIFFFYWPKKET